MGYAEIHLSSFHRDGGTNDTPLWYLRPPLWNVKIVRLRQAILPYGFYNIRGGERATLLFTYPRYSATPAVLQIASGNYTIETLTVTLQEQLNTVPWAAQEHPTVLWDDTKNRFVIVCKRAFVLGEDPVAFTVHFPGPVNDLAHALGFERDRDYTSLFNESVDPMYRNYLTYPTSVVAPYLPRMGPAHVTVWCDTEPVGQRHDEVRDGKQGGRGHVLGVVPVVASPGGLVLAERENDTDMIVHRNGAALTFVTAHCRFDDDSVPMQTNGVEWQVVLGVYT